MHFNFPIKYPWASHEVKFLTKIDYSNIDKEGVIVLQEIGLDHLMQVQVTFAIKSVFLSIQQLLHSLPIELSVLQITLVYKIHEQKYNNTLKDKKVHIMIISGFSTYVKIGLPKEFIIEIYTLDFFQPIIQLFYLHYNYDLCKFQMMRQILIGKQTKSELRKLIYFIFGKFMATLVYIAYLFVGNGVYEVQNPLEGWSNVNFNTKCGGQWITGGYNSFGENSASQKMFSLPEHIFILLILGIVKEFIFTKIDKFVSVFDKDAIKLCGIENWGKNIIEYQSGWHDHTNPTVKINIKSFLDQPPYDESLGWITKIEYFINECFINRINHYVFDLLLRLILAVSFIAQDTKTKYILDLKFPLQT